jgi:hypothetical protein
LPKHPIAIAFYNYARNFIVSRVSSIPYPVSRIAVACSVCEALSL